MVDSLNLLAFVGAPITVFVDEGGTVRAINPPRDSLKDFLNADYDVDPTSAWLTNRPVARGLLAESTQDSARRGDLEFLWGGVDGVDRAIGAYRRILSRNPDDASIYFRLGVAYRQRYDGEGRQSDDFAQAVTHWSKALEMNPNQYIWRRRIQQYGPRLAKPYSFYDWIHEARETIADWGEVPVPLAVEPGGAEFAYPAESFVGAKSAVNPDAEGRIYRDSERLVRIESTVVPGQVQPGDVMRVHIVMQPDEARKVHWNNEVGDLVLWVDVPDGWQVDAALHQYSVPPAPVTVEPRKVEFEVKTSTEGTPLHDIVRGYVLYYICEGVNGQCLYRRQDFEVNVPFGS